MPFIHTLHDKSASKILVNLFLTIAVTRQGSRQSWQRRVCSVGGRFLASSAGDDGALQGGDSIDILGMSLNLSLTMFGVMRHISTFTEAVPKLARNLHPWLQMSDELQPWMPRHVALWRPMRSGKKVLEQRSHEMSCCTCAFQISSISRSSSAPAPPGWSSADTYSVYLGKKRSEKKRSGL